MSDVNTAIKTGKRGRPVGGVSLISVSMSSLFAAVGDKATVKVGRLWLAEQGVSVVNNEAVRKTVEAAAPAQTEAATVEPSVQVS